MIDTSGQLLITHPSGRQEVLPLTHRALRIGCAADNELVLPGSSIAAHHAMLRVGEQGELRIAIAGVEVELPRASAGSVVLRIGGYVLQYATGEAPGQPDRLVQRVAGQPVLHARIDEAALLSSLLGQAAQHEADTIEMTALRSEMIIGA